MVFEGSRTKLIILGVLLVFCAWLVKRNLFPSQEAAVLASLPRQDVTSTSRQGSRTVLNASPRSGQQQTGRSTGEQAIPLDPTIRRDLLEQSRDIEYAGSRRNIFQAYTPPPPPPPVPAASLPPVLRPTPSAAPPAPTIPLKFYGVAVRSGTADKKAFLTDGEEIFIGHEGDMVAKSYRIVRIGVNSIELEDTRSRQRQSLPLQEGE